MKKSQAAVEFMLTYGWAILAALIAIGALVYYGFLSPDVLPDKCTFTNNFECKDYEAGPLVVNIKLVNGLGQSVYSPTLKFNLAIPGNCAPVGLPSSEWMSGVVREWTCTPGPSLISKDNVRAKFTLTYKKTSTGYENIATGELYTTVK